MSTDISQSLFISVDQWSLTLVSTALCICSAILRICFPQILTADAIILWTDFFSCIHNEQSRFSPIKNPQIQDVFIKNLWTLAPRSISSENRSVSSGSGLLQSYPCRRTGTGAAYRRFPSADGILRCCFPSGPVTSDFHGVHDDFLCFFVGLKFIIYM